MSFVSANLRDDKLLGRRDVEATIAYAKNPTRQELKEILAKHLGVEPSSIVVRKANYLTGTHLIKVHAHIYSSQEDAKKLEPKHILIRNNLLEREKK